MPRGRGGCGIARPDAGLGAGLENQTRAAHQQHLKTLWSSEPLLGF